jgi:hypothetical protein
MAINQTIQDFYQQASTRNFARDYQLRIISFIVNGIDQIEEKDLVFLKTATLPGKSIAVQNAAFMGLNFNIPGDVMFDSSSNWTATFYCSQDYNLRKLFEKSMEDTFDQETSAGFLRPRDLQKYKITLALLDDKLNPIMTYNLLGCFVTNVGPINFNMTGSGAVQDVTANIAYQYWVSEKVGNGVGVARGLTSTRELTQGVEGLPEESTGDKVLDDLQGRARQRIEREIARTQPILNAVEQLSESLNELANLRGRGL